jgi:isopenicillin N synthase-like dioxygenase
LSRHPAFRFPTFEGLLSRLFAALWKTTSTMSYVRIIDFSPFPDPQSSPKAKRGPAVGIDKACREIGFFYLSNLGIDQELRSAMLSRAKTFFEEAMEDEKRSISIKPDGAGGGDHAYGFQRVDGGGKEAHEVRA